MNINESIFFVIKYLFNFLFLDFRVLTILCTRITLNLTNKCDNFGCYFIKYTLKYGHWILYFLYSNTKTDIIEM